MERKGIAIKQTDCVLMARVSSREQEVEGYSLPSQVVYLKIIASVKT